MEVTTTSTEQHELGTNIPFRYKLSGMETFLNNDRFLNNKNMMTPFFGGRYELCRTV